MPVIKWRLALEKTCALDRMNYAVSSRLSMLLFDVRTGFIFLARASVFCAARAQCTWNADDVIACLLFPSLANAAHTLGARSTELLWPSIRQFAAHCLALQTSPNPCRLAAGSAPEWIKTFPALCGVTPTKISAWNPLWPRRNTAFQVSVLGEAKLGRNGLDIDLGITCLQG